MYALKSNIQKTFISVTYCLISLPHVHQIILFSSLLHQKGHQFPNMRLNGEGGVRSLGAVTAGASSASASLRARPGSSTPHRPLAQADNAAGFGETLLALGRDPHPLSLLRHPLNVIPQLSATSLRTSNSPGNFEKKNKGAKNKELGRGRKGRGGGALRFRVRPETLPSGRPGSALPARHGAPAAA